MRIGEYCNQDVITMNGEESVKAAAELMRRHHVGDIVLVDERNGQYIPRGIITDRDIVIEVVAKGIDADSLTVQDIITRPLLTVHEDESLLNCLKLMRVKGVRRLPVVNENKVLMGVISFDDITAVLSGMLFNVVGIVDRQQQIETKQRA
ncbi:CBS domain-containing protein [Legionella fallonii]|uniref:CBS domain-containing protein n=1 Tax=Legionella fallonii LLAP-10 TaxID=1212491 RepID=A0A098G0P9_9GAMM|nr:CBS domain-containing protein [Legionella fallonii]CEG55536.1 conserved protein of unknown function with CBS domain [Legionella fallonii LLAP-10]